MTLDVYAHVMPTSQRAAADRRDVVFGEIGGQVGGQGGNVVTPQPTPRRTKKPVTSAMDGLSDVVEMRRLELLTPYMRSKCSTS